MRTISASEANDARPYSILYGGRHVSDLSAHPNQCVPITVGPNKGNCTTAAGRYQFLTGTWIEKAEKYHPERSQVWIRNEYRFAPEFQDEVVYRWLTDTDAWGLDVSAELRQGDLDVVLKRLSGTWTSLGYGIESNTISPILPRIYKNMLAEELSIAQ
jgi:muramidase (phage lysozyme)